ncbi:MAG: hypothetical protein L0Y76_12245 [Ignavibacteria bacterium]|nr:hypothetical protein [Ignavibacteria bacterium]
MENSPTGILRSKSHFLLVLFVTLVSSCSTGKLIPFSEVNSTNKVDIIRLKDGSELNLKREYFRCRVSGDSLIVYNKNDLKTIAIYREPNIYQIVAKSQFPNILLYSVAVIVIGIMIYTRFIYPWI